MDAETPPFYGRVAEQALLEGALGAAAWPFRVLYVWGIDGVGKTALLDRWAEQCAAAGIRALRLDGLDGALGPAIARAAGVAEAVKPARASPAGRFRRAPPGWTPATSGAGWRPAAR